MTSHNDIAHIRKLEIENEANKLLKEQNISTDKGFDIVQLAQRLGFVVIDSDLSDNDDALILVTKKPITAEDNTTKAICVNKNLDGYSKRFVIAHELGHYVLDDKDTESNILIAARDRHMDGKERSAEEQEKDFFAACLLMPKESIEKEYQISKEKFNESDVAILANLQEVFRTPIKSIIRRLNEVGIYG